MFGRALQLADLVITHALEWPSLTVQWLPVSTCQGQAHEPGGATGPVLGPGSSPPPAVKQARARVFVQTWREHWACRVLKTHSQNAA